MAAGQCDGLLKQHDALLINGGFNSTYHGDLSLLLLYINLHRHKPMSTSTHATIYALFLAWMFVKTKGVGMHYQAVAK